MHCSVQWRLAIDRGISTSQDVLKAALHIENIDFELNIILFSRY